MRSALNYPSVRPSERDRRRVNIEAAVSEHPEHVSNPAPGNNKTRLPANSYNVLHLSSLLDSSTRRPVKKQPRAPLPKLGRFNTGGG